MALKLTKNNKRSFAGIEAVRKDLKLKVAEMAEIAGLSAGTWSSIEAGNKDLSATAAWRAATVTGYGVDDILNTHASSVDRLLAEHRPLFRLPYNIDKPYITSKIAELNDPKLLREEHFWAGGFANRCELLIATTRKIAEKELESNEYREYGLSAFVPLEKQEDGSYPVISDPSVKDGLKLGAAFTAICRILDLSTLKLSEMTGLSRIFISSLQNDIDEPTLGNLDLAAAAVGHTIDELIAVAHPFLLRWPFHVQRGPVYANQEMVGLLTNPETIKTFCTVSTVEERAAMMVGYRNWLAAEAAQREASVKENVITPAAFRLIGWSAA